MYTIFGGKHLIILAICAVAMAVGFLFARKKTVDQPAKLLLVIGLPFLTEEYGWPVYICHYAFTVVFCVTLCYLKPILAALQGKKTRAAA